MVSSGKSGGSSSPPNQPTPAGNLVDYGNTSAPAAWSGAQNTLPNTGQPMTIDLLSQQWQNPSWGAPVGPAPPPPAQSGGGWGGADAFAQQLLDYRKAAMGNPLYAMQHQPTAQGPAQQLMLSMANDTARNRLAQLMPAYNIRGGR
jgi:hypothetical protein